MPNTRLHTGFFSSENFACTSLGVLQRFPGWVEATAGGNMRRFAFIL